MDGEYPDEEDMAAEYSLEEISDLDAGPPEHRDTPVVYRLEHFKVLYDPSWDYAGVVESMFNGDRILVMREQLNLNTHVHFQGYTNYSEHTFLNMCAKLGKQHWKKKRRLTLGWSLPVAKQVMKQFPVHVQRG
jgi:hypothetical protein